MSSQYPQQSGGYPRPPNQSNYYSSIEGLAIVCAIACTLLTAPLLTVATDEWARALILKFYGHGLVDFGILVWKLLCFAFVFFLTRAFVVAMVVAMGVGLAQRFPMLLI